MAQTDAGVVIRELHQDLARKYRLHGPTIETLWRGFTRAQRTKAIKEGAAEGVVLKNRMDPSMGEVYKLLPEWNLRDVTESSDFLPNLLRYRATTKLMEQYSEHHLMNPGGDLGFITTMMQTRNLRHVDERRLNDSFTVFLDDDDHYGKSFTISEGVDRSQALGGFSPAIQGGLCVPQSTAELIFMRQSGLLQALNIIIEDILDIGSKTRAKKKQTSKDVDTAPAPAMSQLSIQAQPTKRSLTELLEVAKDQKALSDEHLYLLTVEPVVLAHAVNITFFSRPELVADEKGRSLPVHTDRFISPAFFDVIHGAVQDAAIWNYLHRLLELLEEAAADKVRRAIILQEISNAGHLQYDRTQSLLKRQVQTGTGKRYFKRVSNVYDKGNARVAMKIKPEELTRADPQLHYLLRLCQADTTAATAVEWMEKLGSLHMSHPDEREKLAEREFNALWDHTAIVAFMQDLALAISMPPRSRKTGQVFVARYNDLETELNNTKSEIDLTQFVVPIDNLEEPGVAPNALRALEEAIIDKKGTKLGFMYQDLIDDCIADLEKQYQKIQTKVEQKKEHPQYPVEDPQVRTEQRRQKEKTRPSHSSVFELVRPTKSQEQKDTNTLQQRQTFVVKKTTAEVFTTLFDKSESRRPVSWVAFEAALADLGFSVVPKFGSVYTFVPPETMALNKSLTLHRPHKSNIEGWLVPIFARRLHRLYGWGKDTFQVE
ncbi:hypothetical protein M406DRAFT_341360 [Cryphonectria parasitica EP155]|uniref:Ipa protein n=1 Tax=Cryphonectria parasitica (strain ATCC 38755 / EP155) TaxID=660469 RepID=A0A9P4Y085_CRYP1|nr:uncharacterized protein M406DRAFT_341360 [Cryphonectria parasitica EP155]KAF3764005.1 hypothetical protein M406DRAFT_341360 [Cryphonectria parasitica EP155]